MTYPPPGNYPGRPYPPQQPPPRQPYPPQPGYPPQQGYPGYPPQPYPQQPGYPPPGYPPAPGYPPPGYPGGPPKSSSKKPLLIGGGVLLMVLILIGGGILLFSGASSTFALTDEAKIKAVMAEIGKAGPGPNANLYCADFNKLLERFSKDFGNDFGGTKPEKDGSTTEITSINVNGDEATVNLKNSRSGSASVRFVKEGGKWKLCPEMPSLPDMP